MKIIKKTVLVIILLFCTVLGFSQNNDTIPKVKKDSTANPGRTVAYAADKLAIVRPLNMEFSKVSPYNFSSKTPNASFPQGRVQRLTQAKISANYNFIKTKTWLLGATAQYRYTQADASMTNPFSAGPAVVNENYHYLASSVNFTYFSTLFKKRAIYSSSLIVDGSDQHLERIKGLLTGVIVMKATPKTKMTLGLALYLDPSIGLPVIPVFTYEHKFNNGLIADITLPKSVYLRKYVFNAGRISLGAELDRPSFYLYGIDGTNQRYEYRQLDINSGLLYEHALGNFVLTAKTGLKYTPAGRLFKKEDSFNDPVFETKPETAFYFNLGISFNPFTFLNSNSK